MFLSANISIQICVPIIRYVISLCFTVFFLCELGVSFYVLLEKHNP
jgi:hypothetical protein